MRIGVDLMGGDSSPEVLFKAVEGAVEKFPQAIFIVFVTQVALENILVRFNDFHGSKLRNIEFHIVSEVIEMHEEPLIAIRSKKNSSLALGIKFLRKRYLDAFVSSGNTGAMIAGATLSLPLLPSIKRPALLATLPTERGSVAIIDVGGNVSCKALHLAQFAQLGAAYQRCFGIEQPKVGLLNIGVESKKGTSEVRQAYELLQGMSQKGEIDFIGNIEGRDVFQGAVDVLVTDGFTGNVLLKTSEGVSSFILQQLHNSFQRLFPDQSSSVLGQLNHQFNYEEYNGAIVCGVDCVAVKCHGHSSPKGFLRGIQVAAHLVQNHFVHQIKQQFTL